MPITVARVGTNVINLRQDRFIATPRQRTLASAAPGANFGQQRTPSIEAIIRYRINNLIVIRFYALLLRLAHSDGSLPSVTSW
jgi:hypothetical protein